MGFSNWGEYKCRGELSKPRSIGPETEVVPRRSPASRL